ncbi:MAG TPA: hypothetical protein VG347_10920 [Verrucomicrobiae bacterium]|nr:hypothetical protein [Verrucomicrobiae bacterium]
MNKFILFFLGFAVMYSAVRGLSAEYTMSDSEAKQLRGFIDDLNSRGAAYKPIAFEKMLGEANFFASQLKLLTPHPIQLGDINDAHFSTPWHDLVNDTNFASPLLQARRGKITAGGFIETTNFIFYFSKGRLWSICNREMTMERFDLYPKWHATLSLVDSNGAYELATQWLASVGVDIAALKSKYGSQTQVEQAFFWNPPGSTNRALLPIFNVTWGDGSKSEFPAQVRVLGTTKEIMELRVFDSSLSTRMPLVISRVDMFERYTKAPTNLPVMHMQPTPILLSTNAPNSDRTNEAVPKATP